MQGCGSIIEFLYELLNQIKTLVDTYDVYSSDNEQADEEHFLSTAK